MAKVEPYCAGFTKVIEDIVVGRQSVVLDMPRLEFGEYANAERSRGKEDSFGLACRAENHGIERSVLSTIYYEIRL